MRQEFKELYEWTRQYRVASKLLTLTSIKRRKRRVERVEKRRSIKKMNIISWMSKDL